MQGRFVRLLLAAAIFGSVPSAPSAQKVDSQIIKNLKSQQTSIENRIADLQSQVDDAFAGKTYCTSAERQEDLRKLRALQREILALRNEYAEFKAGFIKLASTPTAGPQFDAAGIHPADRQYWATDDKALAKLRDSALAKAERVEKAPIRDCNEKKPTSAPPSSAPPKPVKPITEQPGSTPTPTTAPPPVKGPTTPLGGQQAGTYCTEQQRIDELFRLQQELIKTDGTTAGGRARQQELQRQIERVKNAKVSSCVNSQGSEGPPPDKLKAKQPLELQKPKQAPEIPHDKTSKVSKAPPDELSELVVNRLMLEKGTPFQRLTRRSWYLLEDLDHAFYDCDADWVDEIIPKLKASIDEARAMLKSGSLSKEEAEDLVSMISDLTAAWEYAASIPSCPKFVLSDEIKKKVAPEPTKPGQPEIIPPKIDLVEDLRDPPTPFEVRAIEARVKELSTTTGWYPDVLEGCQSGIWDKHIARLEDLAKRARQIAGDVKSGYSNGVNSSDAERLADEAQKAVDEAKREKANNGAKWKVPDCPETVPEQPTPPLQQPKLDKTSLRILEIHNEERLAVHVPLLKWNFQLQRDATAWAQQLAVNHQLVHAPREGRGIERENLLETNIGWSPDRMMQSWTMEKRDFRAGYYPDVALDGNWLNVSHYTQMIWPTTTDIGCGYATGGGYGWLVCRYSPGGNKDGKPVGMPYMPERG